MKKVIRVPNPIILVDKDINKVGDTVSFATFVRRIVLVGKEFSSGLDGLKAAVEIDKLISEGKMEIEVDVSTWSKMEKEVKNPSNGQYNLPPNIMIQLMEFLDAIIGASDKKE